MAQQGLSIYKVRRVVAVVVAVVSFGVWIFNNYQLPKIETNAETGTVAEKAESATAAINVLEELTVQNKYIGERYYRKAFYKDWGEIDGCRTREVILKRDLKETVMNGCKVMSGILEDPYTGTTIKFTRGQDTSAEVQIDHVVALSNAWATGAYKLTKEERYALSQDPMNLLAVDGGANQGKSDQDAASWLPQNKSFQCEYVARQISVKKKYRLWVTADEKSAMTQVLSTCPKQETLSD